jgi:tetratricopeptide (TPR) repeat protein
MARGGMNAGTLTRVAAALALLVVFVLPARARGQTAQAPPDGAKREAAGLAVLPAVEAVIREIYAGDPGAAIAAARTLESEHPSDPLGYLVEAEARWWRLYCRQSEIRYGMVDVWKLPKLPEEKPYLKAAQKAVQLGEAHLAVKPSALAYLWVGMGYAFEARLYGLRGEKMATARAGVDARKNLLKALELDPQLADANTGLGLYNYYVDTLSPIVKLLRIFLGIPGGSKKEGVRQLRAAMERGRLTPVEARFYLAKNLRTYDHNYAEALEVAQPLVRDYPQNPIFLLLVGNLEIELGRQEEAAETLERIAKLDIPDEECARRSKRLAQELIAAEKKK